MKNEEKTTAVAGLIILIVILLIIISVAVAFLFSQGIIGGRASPEIFAVEYLKSLDISETLEQYIVSTDGEKIYIDKHPATEEAKILYEGLKGRWTCVVDSVETTRKQAKVTVNITCPGINFIEETVGIRFRENLKTAVSAASRASDIYDDSLCYRGNVLDDAFREALSYACSQPERINMTVQTDLLMEYSRKEWSILNPAQITDTLDDQTEQIRARVTESAEYIPLSYHLDETALCGPAPDQSKFGETTDPEAVMTLLATPQAKKLIGSENLCFNPALDFYPGSTVRVYLDESILMIQWQETEQNMCGTFAEIFVADGSQFRRKIAGDAFGDMNFRTTSAFAQETNAVLAVGGDFYNHSRNCGIIVYNRQICRFDPNTCDTCYVTADGDLLFSYRGQWTDISEAQKFVDENNIVFSIGFGPVMVDRGIDVTPDDYAWGEVNDTYARAALGMLGKNHYLTMNLNCGGGAYYNYATLRQAADAMIKKHCIKAYTLDGGQTATTAVNGVLVNPVQFGWEKEISDILYFCSAVPER